MIELSPPYRKGQLEAFANTITSTSPPEGYPLLKNRLSAYQISRNALRRRTGVIYLPSGHDATNSPHRRSATENRATPLDPDIATGSDQLLSSTKIARFISAGYLLDQHGRPLHSGFPQLLSFSSQTGDLIGMPTGIGRFYYYGRNGVSYGIVFRKNQKKEEEVLLVHSLKQGWVLPGGYERSSDSIAPNLDSSILCATRKVFDATCLEVDGIARVIACMLPIGPDDTLNAWREFRAVTFTNGNDTYLHDVSVQPRGSADAAEWILASDILRGEVMIPPHQERYVAEAHEVRLKGQNM